MENPIDSRIKDKLTFPRLQYRCISSPKTFLVLLFCICWGAVTLAQAQPDEDRSRGKRRKIEQTKPTKPATDNNAPKPILATGSIIGKVTDKVSSEGLYGVAVKVEGTTIGTTTDLEGNFVIRDLKQGIYQLNIEYISYRSVQLRGIIVKAGKEINVQVGMDESITELESVQIIAEVEKASDMAILNTQKNASSILDGMSGDMIVKEASYYQMNNVLRRMPSVTLIEDRFLSIRGLFERYNNVIFNGTLLPYADLERTGFDFASMPSGVVTQLQLQKSSVADQFTDFSGGLVNITTADIPIKDNFRMAFQVNYNDMSSFKPFQSYPSQEAQGWSLIRNIERQPSDLPTSRQLAQMPHGSEERYAAGRKLVHHTVPNQFTAPLGQNFNVTYQKRIKIDKDTEAGVTAYVNYFDYYKFQYASVNYLDTFIVEKGKSGVTDSSQHRYFARQQNLTALLNLGISRKNTVISWKTLTVINGEDVASIAKGVVFDPEGIKENDYHYTYPITRFTKSQMWCSQIEGQHAFNAFSEQRDPIRLTWNANYTRLVSDEPGYKAVAFYVNPETGQEEFLDPLETPTQTTFISRNEFNNFGTRFKFQIPIVPYKAHLGAGMFMNYAYRKFRSQNLGLFIPGEFSTDSLPTDLPMSTFHPANWRNVFNKDHIGPNRFDLYDYSDGSFNYDAYRTQLSPFVVLNAKYKKWRINAGIRLETFIHSIDTFPLSAELPEKMQMLQYNMTDVLPSLNLAYGLSQKSNLRFSFSQTVTRPSDRELVPFTFFDLFSGTFSVGNANLVRTKTTNLDLRFEYYPSGKELLSATLFYKHFSNPLEQIFTEGIFLAEASFGQRYIVANQSEARAVGLELESRINLGSRFESDYLKNFTFIGNFTLLRSRVNKTGILGVFEDGRSLQGQATYVLNLGVLFTEPKSKVSLGMFYNRAGDRIAYVGVGADRFPSVVELPRHVLDIQLTRSITKRSTLQLALTDIFNQPIRLVQYGPDNNTWQEGRDQYMRILQRGFSVYLTFTLQLK